MRRRKGPFDGSIRPQIRRRRRGGSGLELNVAAMVQIPRAWGIRGGEGGRRGVGRRARGESSRRGGISGDRRSAGGVDGEAASWGGGCREGRRRCGGGESRGRGTPPLASPPEPPSPEPATYPLRELPGLGTEGKRRFRAGTGGRVSTGAVTK